MSCSMRLNIILNMKCTCNCHLGGSTYCIFCKDARHKNKNAAALGKLGGKVKSEAKANAVRENGKKGGRPKKQSENQ